MLLHNLLLQSTPSAWDGGLVAECPETEGGTALEGVPEDAGCGCGTTLGRPSCAWLLLVLAAMARRRGR